VQPVEHQHTVPPHRLVNGAPLAVLNLEYDLGLTQHCRKERLENYVRGLASHRAVLRSDTFRNFLQFPDALYSPNDVAFDDSFAEFDDGEHEEICHAHSSAQATPRDLDVSIGSGTGAQLATPNTALAPGGEEGRAVGRDDVALEALHARVATLQSKNDA
jgi:hypothetical protein